MNKNKLLLEAVKYQQKKLGHIEGILKEALAHPVFESLKQFENEIEYQLFESFGRAPRSGSIVVGGGRGEALFGKHGETFETLRKAIDNLPKVSNPLFSSRLIDLLNAAEAVVQVRERSDNLTPDAVKQINIQLIRLETKLKESLDNLSIVKDNLSNEFKKISNQEEKRENQKNRSNINQNVNKITRYLNSLKGMKNPIDVETAKKQAEEYEAEEYEAELKKKAEGGIFSRLARKVFG